MPDSCYRSLLDWASGKCFTVDTLIGAMNAEIFAMNSFLFVRFISAIGIVLTRAATAARCWLGIRDKKFFVFLHVV